MRGIYIHMPFCLRKCRYCDFLSFPNMGFYDDYIKALKNEIKSYNSKEKISTIYIGGGTPSIANPCDIADILEIINDNYDVSCVNEITIEANPKTIDKEKLDIYRKSGINRLSIGLQSANDNELKLLGRVHSYDEFYNNYMLARKCGFNNISIDVMSGIPEQTLESYMETLNKVIKLNPEHISSYSLIIEEGTYFYDHLEELTLPDEDTEREMYYKTNEILKSAGYQRYEISNYAKKGYESRHNSSYWKCMEYYGFGIGASSFIA
ncbi:MAG: radical SAM family heme chaperone HemW [Lachnospiraceae bacterium]|nr:radical SAM family heme chaperone HemW [Lachnospiraceae bacterium]